MNDKITPKEESQESLAEVIKPIVPLVEQYLTTQSEVAKMQVNQNFEMSKLKEGNQFEFAGKKLEMERTKRTQDYIFVLLVLGAVFGISFFLLYRGDTTSALLVISHAVAIAAGWLGGTGWEKGKKKE